MKPDDILRFKFLLIDRDLTIGPNKTLCKCSGCREVILVGDYALRIKKLNGGGVKINCQRCAKNTLLFEIHQLQEVLGKLPEV